MNRLLVALQNPRNQRVMLDPAHDPDDIDIDNLNTPVIREGVPPTDMPESDDDDPGTSAGWPRTSRQRPYYGGEPTERVHSLLRTYLEGYHIRWVRSNTSFNHDYTSLLDRVGSRIRTLLGLVTVEDPYAHVTSVTDFDDDIPPLLNPPQVSVRPQRFSTGWARSIIEVFNQFPRDPQPTYPTMPAIGRGLLISLSGGVPRS
jgi:hypothetical protein